MSRLAALGGGIDEPADDVMFLAWPSYAGVLDRQTGPCRERRVVHRRSQTSRSSFRKRVTNLDRCTDQRAGLRRFQIDASLDVLDSRGEIPVLDHVART